MTWVPRGGDQISSVRDGPPTTATGLHRAALSCLFDPPRRVAHPAPSELAFLFPASLPVNLVELRPLAGQLIIEIDSFRLWS